MNIYIDYKTKIKRNMEKGLSKHGFPLKYCPNPKCKKNRAIIDGVCECCGTKEKFMNK